MEKNGKNGETGLEVTREREKGREIEAIAKKKKIKKKV